MRITVALVFATLTLIASSALATPSPYPMPRTQAIPITDKVTGGQYTLYIKVPEEYETNKDTPLKHYPVIYTTDAQWHMDLLSGVTAFLMPDVILVGVSWQHNMPSDIVYGHRRPFASRFKDYSFVAHDNPDVQAKYHFGQADKHIRFLQDDIIPYVEQHYRTMPDKRAYLGYSMGAEFGAYIMLNAPTTFRYYVLGSPSLDDTSFKFLKALTVSPSTKQTVTTDAFVSIGELETTRMALTKDFVALLEAKATRGISVNGLHIMKDSDHTSAVPETFSRGVKWLEASIMQRK